MTEILTNNDLFCFCGAVARVNINGFYTCKEHIGKKPKEKTKSIRFRGDSKYQQENGYFDGKEGSNA